MADETELCRSVKNYLECEALLKEFFDAVGYCREKCITGADGAGKKGIGCCTLDHIDSPREWATPLDTVRVERYGAPAVRPSLEERCGYHTMRGGCRLKDCKLPVCVAYACKRIRALLKSKYQIRYKWTQTYSTILDVERGDISSSELEWFKSELREMIEKVKSAKG